MSKMSKEEWDRHAAAGLPMSPYPITVKQYDTRQLDRMEAFCGQYRAWLNTSTDAFPSGYVTSQREAYRRHIIQEAREMLAALCDEE